MKAERRARHTPLTPLVIALHLTSNKIFGALVDDRARILAERQTALTRKTVRSVGPALAELITEIGQLSERHTGEIKAIGLSIPGIVDPRSERVSISTLDWTRVLLRPVIERGLGQSGIDIRLPQSIYHSKAARTEFSHPPIAIVSASSAKVAAEAWIGAARGKQHVVNLCIEREIQAGILSDGKIIHGMSDLAGSVGWFALSENYRPEYEQNGCLTTEANEAAIVRRTIESWTSDKDSALSRITSADPSHLTPDKVIRAARSGDELANQVTSDVCSWIGRAVANLISLLNPEVVVIGGELGQALQPFLGEIRREAERWAHPEAIRSCRLVTTRIGERAILLGAARVALLKA